MPTVTAEMVAAQKETNRMMEVSRRAAELALYDEDGCPVETPEMVDEWIGDEIAYTEWMEAA